MAVTVTDATNDFGFSFVDEEEVAKNSNTVTNVIATKDDYKDRLERVIKAIQPFLRNLQANPNQIYMKWPDRAKKVAEFERKINNIYEGKL
jgi:argonaute-like protein implicated in RNA metabolism and viral defense